MPRNKKKRKNSAPHHANPPPARPAPIDGRRFISYEDLETMPTPPVPRHMVSYASSDDGADVDQDVRQGTQDEAASELSAAEQRHRIMSRESDGTYDAGRAQPRTDPTYGQVGAFPGLDTFQFAPFYGPANDGLDYLRMVRSEARDIPHIVTSTSRKRMQRAQEDYEERPQEGDEQHRQPHAEEEEYEDYDYDYPSYSLGDEGDGYYSDGAYVAKPLSAAAGYYQETSISPQEAYYTRLKDLFAAHRARCYASPSAAAVAALDAEHPISYPQGSSLATKEWRTLLLRTTPLPAQLCSMDKWTIWRLLRLCERSLRAHTLRVENVPSNLALWVWGLLGRLPEGFQMRNEEVSKLRDLGKLATWAITELGYRKSRRGMFGPEKVAMGYDGGWDYDEDDEEDVNSRDDEKSVERKREGMNDDDDVASSLPREQDKPTEDHPNSNPAVETSHAGTTTQDGDHIMTNNQDLSDLLAAKKHQLQSESQQAAQAPPPTTSDLPGKSHQPNQPEAEVQAADGAQIEESEMKAKAKTIEDEEVEVPDAQTSALFDCIITVIGEFYGQRDLLWSRQKWEREVEG